MLQNVNNVDNVDNVCCKWITVHSTCRNVTCAICKSRKKTQLRSARHETVWHFYYFLNNNFKKSYYKIQKKTSSKISLNSLQAVVFATASTTYLSNFLCLLIQSTFERCGDLQSLPPCALRKVGSTGAARRLCNAAAPRSASTAQ